MPSITREQLFTPQNIDDVAPDTLFTVPSNPVNLLLINGRIRFVNHTGGAVTITAWAVPSGDTAGNTNLCLAATSIATLSYIDLDIPQMPAGAFLQAQAGAANSITAQSIDGAYYAP